MKVGQRHTNDRFAGLSAAPLQALAGRKGFTEFLDALAKRAPAFSNISVGVRHHLAIGRFANVPVWELTEFYMNLGFKAGAFRKFAEGEGVYGLFSEFFCAKYFDKLQRCYGRALSVEANRILRRLQCGLPKKLPPLGCESVVNDLVQRLMSDRVWPPTQLILDVFNEIAIRFVGNGTPLRLYQHVITWNTQRNGCERESREFLVRLGRAVRERPKEMFDKNDCVIMLFSADEMSCGIPPIPRWRDEAGLGLVKLASGDRTFSMDAYRDRFTKLGLSPERPKLVKGSLNSDALVIKWAKPVRNLVKSRTGKN
jgi:hypothetical protein